LVVGYELSATMALYQGTALVVALYVAWYKLCCIHMTLRVTPAMEARIADHAWSVVELVA
jgi:hypothetical protein